MTLSEYLLLRQRPGGWCRRDARSRGCAHPGRRWVARHDGGDDGPGSSRPWQRAL